MEQAAPQGISPHDLAGELAAALDLTHEAALWEVLDYIPIVDQLNGIQAPETGSTGLVRALNHEDAEVIRMAMIQDHRGGEIAVRGNGYDTRLNHVSDNEGGWSLVAYRETDGDEDTREAVQVEWYSTLVEAVSDQRHWTGTATTAGELRAAG